MITILGLFWDTLVSLVVTWYRSETFSHGFLVLPLSLYLVWIRRHRVAQLCPSPNYTGLIILAALGFGWLLGNLTGTLIAQQLALVAMLQGLVWTLLGPTVTRALLFPLAFLFFALPIGEMLELPLQDFTAFLTVMGLQLTGIPVYLDGHLLVIPSGTWEVSEACSGLRYLLASLILGCLYASTVYQSWIRRLGFVLAAIVIPIPANGLRAYGIIMIGHLSHGKFAIGADHLVYGWLFFGAVFALLSWLGTYWQEPVAHLSAKDHADIRDIPVASCSIPKMALTAVGAVLILGLIRFSVYWLALPS